jgi:hypothetical protein
MKISMEELTKLMEDLSGSPDVLKSTIRGIFKDTDNIALYSKFFFPHIIQGKVPDFHLEWYKLYFSKEDEVLAAPRGFAKSTIFGVIGLSHDIVYKTEEYIIYTSKNHASTVKFLEPIKTEFKTNKLLRWVYGDLTPSNTRDIESGKDREDIFDVNGIRIEAVSFEKNPRGFRYGNRRPTKIILDDIEDDERVLNPDLRMKDQNKLNKAIIPAKDILKGKIKYIGTILHINSLLSKKLEELNGRKYQSITDEVNKTVLWPERFSYETLMKEKKRIGSIAFRQEYQNDPSDSETSIIKREWLIECRRPDISYEDLLQGEYTRKVMGGDFAFADRVTSDRTAFVGLGVKEGYFYLLLCDLKKGLSVGEQFNYLRYTIQPKYNFDKMGLEENSIKSVSKDLKQYNLPIKLYWTGSKDQVIDNNFTDFSNVNKSQTIGKTNLIQRMATDVENRRLIIPYKTERDKELYEQIEAELITFALQSGKLVEGGVHSDIGIALGYALELAREEDQMMWIDGKWV